MQINPTLYWGGEAFQGHSVEEASVKHFWGVKLFHMGYIKKILIITQMHFELHFLFIFTTMIDL